MNPRSVTSFRCEKLIEQEAIAYMHTQFTKILYKLLLLRWANVFKVLVPEQNYASLG